MSRSQFPINVNASLMHEVRMIAMQFLRSRENTTFWKSRKTAAAPASWVPKCAICIRRKKLDLRGVLEDAVTMTSGEAVCERHLI